MDYVAVLTSPFKSTIHLLLERLFIKEQNKKEKSLHWKKANWQRNVFVVLERIDCSTRPSQITHITV
jgi:hypothetical protein